MQFTTSRRHSLGFLLRMLARNPPAGLRLLFDGFFGDDGDDEASAAVVCFVSGFLFIMAILVGAAAASAASPPSPFPAAFSFTSAAPAAASFCWLLGSLMGLILTPGLTRLCAENLLVPSSGGRGNLQQTCPAWR